MRISGITLLRHANHSSDSSDSGDHLRLDLSRATTEDLAGVFNKLSPDAIINAVGWVGHEADMLQELNDELVARMLVAIARAAPSCRFVHLGSAAEYGAGPVGLAVTEATEARPLSAYCRSKLAGTRAVVGAAERGDVLGVVLRVFNPIGAGMAPGSLPADAAARLVSAASKGLATVEFGKLDEYRDFVDASDVGQAIAAAANSARIDSRIINVGSGTPTVVREVVRILAAIAGFEGQIVESGEGSRRSSAVPWQMADISQANRELGWRPQRGLHESLGQLMRSRGART